MPNASTCSCPYTTGGIVHQSDCWMASKPSPPAPIFSYLDPNAARIADALERIAKAMEGKPR